MTKNLNTKSADTKTAARKTAARKSKTKKRDVKKTTAHKLLWRDVSCRVRHTPNYISKGWSHIEIIVLKPKGAPIPITSTGYLSHFLDAEMLAAAGGPVRFFLDWIERESRTRQWAKTEFRWRQLELFPR